MENKRKKESRKEASGESSANGSRWQPTKEQIEILESVYSAGVKTPSAEQIQQITARLSAYGHIEGKNVFYWFQNTKARRRQKQKQDQRLAYLTRFYHAPPIFPIPPPPPPHYVPPITPNGYYYYPYGVVAGPARVEPTRWGPRECKTLELFPLQPGGGGVGGGDSNSGASSNSSDRDDEYYYSASACKDGEEGFIDFLSGNCCSSSATETD